MKGKGPTAALLVSTPQTGIDSILATYALMGPVFAVARPVAAALTGIVGGVVVSAVFLAAMMAYNFARPVRMGHRHG